MARGSEKKSAAQRAEVIAIWQPLLITINTVYIILRFYIIGGIVPRDTTTFQKVVSISGILSTLFLQYYAYLGILEDASNSKRDKNKLVGGVHLDIIALTIVIQYGVILLSPKVYYLLVIFPTWGGWYLYKTFIRSNNNNNTPSSSSQEQDISDDPNQQRKQQRAEKRRQKWS